MVDMSVDIAGLCLRNPVMLASGTFGHGAEYAGWLDFTRIGGVVTKTITMSPRAGNRPPRTVETPAGMLNSIGLQNPGLEGFIAEKLPALKDLPTAVVVSIAGTSVEEFAEMARRLDGLPGVHALELNISSPNMKDGGMLFGCSPRAAHDVTAAVKRAVRTPLIVKLTPNVTDIAEIAAAVEEGGADAVALINTLLGMAVDARTRRPILGNVTGGLSGPAIKPVALAMTWRVARRVRIPVVGMGGISTARDAVEFLIVGASAVQVGTATFIHPTCALEVAEGIEAYCREAGVSRVQEIVGTLKAE
ncbi:MAG: dihydroorotate dehydrogenase [Candidatus Latescibacteria bacterium]|nr:dihydroorotate dehydrogenase [Candidatus Latescibacterota bacterium]